MTDIIGTEAGESLVGTPGNDHLQGLGGDDSLFGYGGDDYLIGGTGRDTMDGGLGSDFDGVADLPEGLGDVSGYPRLLAELADRGWSDAELLDLAGRNTLRVLRAAEEAAEAPEDPSA